MAAIAAAAAYSAVGVAAAHLVEYGWAGPYEFSFFNLSNHGTVEFCNRVPFWAEHTGSVFELHIGEEVLGQFSTERAIFEPLGRLVQEGRFTSEQFPYAQHTMSTADIGLELPDSFDVNEIRVIHRMGTSLLGFIPYHAEHVMSGSTFYVRMSEPC
ncbi:putative Thr operon leader peptide [Nitrosopumilaceae archaeon]|nr:hypothetical protein [Nitrosopumilus sp.]MDA8002397.1 hypothetical protein [Alphaproteobacteria bacterium]CAI9832324.1 putative Thr operon leader peptide [Nitrosopumilaceae archaeon]MDA7945494.1 hypothetical protein [Nitrosopumilus sp.]MDA7954855.1 hypothetical protein [Nitrosopumilus sp.]